MTLLSNYKQTRLIGPGQVGPVYWYFLKSYPGYSNDQPVFKSIELLYKFLPIRIQTQVKLFVQNHIACK